MKITKKDIKSTYELVRALILMMMLIVLGLAITTGTADAKMVVEVSKGVKPSERREIGVKSINIDKSFAVDKHCAKYYGNGIKFDACVEKIEAGIDARYKMIDRAWRRK